MPLTAAQQTTLSSLKTLRASSKKQSTPHAQSTTPDHPEEEPRRSARKPRPSAHGIESHKWPAAKVPSGRKSVAKANSVTKQKKNPFGVRGDRPGRIVQPAADYGTIDRDDSPEPLATNEADLGVQPQKAIRLATKYLQQDASGFSSQTLKKVLEELPSLDEDGSPGPMDIEKRNSPTQLKSAGRILLGGGLQSPYSGSAYEKEIDPEAANTEPGAGASAPTLGKRLGAELDVEEPVGDTPMAENTNTELEPDTEVIELWPSDSVSQQLPRFQTPASKARSTGAETQTPPPHHTKVPRTPPLKHRSAPIIVDNNSESDDDAVNLHKRPRLTQPLPRPRTQQTLRPLPLGILHLSSSKVSPLPLHAARHMPPRSSGSCGPSIRPPPTSNINSALAWAVEFVNQQVRSHATTSKGAGSSSEPDFSVLARVLGEIQTLADSSLAPQPTVPHTVRPIDLINDHLATLEAEAAIALGKQPRVRKQPALSDYPGLPGQIASLAIPELVATAISGGPYEGSAVNDEWAMDVFKAVADRQTGGQDVEDPPRGLRALMIRRISVFRGDALDRIRPLTSYRRQFIPAPETVADVRYNIDLADSLLPNTFHCRDPAREIDAYEDSTLREYIALVLFWAPDSLGVVFHKMFYPLPIPFIALVLTLMQHAIGEWKTGRHIKTELNAKVQAGVYESHVLGVLNWEKEANARFEEFRENAFWYGINHAGVGDELHEPHQPVTWADNIRPDSPATRARAKGKARAAH
ncbi:hypothetical protein RhiJN_24674 [Ceratobasidium sp. AG-Ba]|nr:hypothetical protein RhiJN_24674 [Ceratobasidium sp. AG-Ba]